MCDDAIFVFDRESIQTLDRLATEEFGVPSIVLMENAASEVAAEAARLLRLLEEPGEVTIFCGPGNNGGDGFAAARHLVNGGHAVQIIAAFDVDGGVGRLSDAARVNFDICRRMAIPIHSIYRSNSEDLHDDLEQRLDDHARDGALIIDALLGVGATGAPRPPFDRLIRWMNARATPVLSVDLPSGLDCDSGRVEGECVRADLTVSFVGLKQGFLELDAQSYVGEVSIADIGAPIQLLERFGQPVEIDPFPDEIEERRSRRHLDEDEDGDDRASRPGARPVH